MGDLRALLDAATPGPWAVEATGIEYVGENDEEVESGWFRGPAVLDAGDYETLRLSDVEFVVALVNAAPALLDELDALRGALERIADLGTRDDWPQTAAEAIGIARAAFPPNAAHLEALTR